jgi:hypothetical protein
MHTYHLPAAGPQLANIGDFNDVIGDAFSANAERVVLPVERLTPEFFRLSSGLAGEALQKFTNYHLRVAIVGDISAYTETSGPLRDFVRESNRRGDVRFLASAAEL